MALEHAHGAIQWNTADGLGATKVVNGLAFQPKAIRFYWMGLGAAVDTVSQVVHFRGGVGFATGAAARRCVSVVEADAAADSFGGGVCRNDAIASTMSAAAVPVQDGALDLTAIAADGFTLTVDDVTPANITVFWDAWGGTDITVAQIVDIAEPAATGNVDYSVTGFTAGGTDQVVMFAGCQSTAAINTVQDTDCGLMVGFASSGTAADNVVAVVNSDDASATMDTQNYTQDGECLALHVVAGGNPNARAQLTQFGTDNFRLNWIARGLTNRRYIGLAIKGGQWKAGALVMNTTVVGNTGTVSALPFQPKGIATIDAGGPEAVAGTATTPGRLCMGSGSATTSRRAMGVTLSNAIAAANVSLTMEYDAIVSKPTAAGAVGLAVDINAINSDGFQLIVDVVSGAGDANDWIGYLAFADAVAGGVGELAGAATQAFSNPGTLTGRGALLGVAAQAFANTALLGGKGVLVSAAAQVFTNTGVLTGKGALAAVAAQVFLNTGTLTGRGALLGTTAQAFLNQGTLTEQEVGGDEIAGAAAIVFTNTGTLTGKGALAGAAAKTFANTAVLTGRGQLAGVTIQAFADTATLTGKGALTGTVPITFTNTGTFGGPADVLEIFSGVNKAGGITYHIGVSRPGFTRSGTNLTRKDGGSGDFRVDSVSSETYTENGDIK